MSATVTEIVSFLLSDPTPQADHPDSNLVIERFDEWHNPTGTNLALSFCG